MKMASIRISTHNIHGFASSKEFIHSRCDTDSNLIQCVQEHWLSPPYKKRAGTNALRIIHPDFEGYGVSAMKQSEQNQIRRGRGFGETGFIYPKSFSHVIKPLSKYNHDRVSVMELNCSQYCIIIINIYMPFLNRSDVQGSLNEFDAVIGYVEYVMSQFVDAQFVILGDFNCNVYDRTHPFTASFTDFLESHDLKNTFSLMNNFSTISSYTRYDTRSRSLLDYIFVSNGLSSLVSDVSIGDYHDNVSDHLPVELTLSVSTSTKKGHSKGVHRQSGFVWSKLNSDSLADYASTMETALDLIQIPPSLLHGPHLCNDICHNHDIEMYFDRIYHAIQIADSVIERTNFRALKPFWSPELSNLKHDSYISHQAWIQAGKPRNGVVYENYLSARGNYRRQLRLEKRQSSVVMNDKLLSNLVAKDSVAFWRSWKSMSNEKDPLSARIDGLTEDASISDHFANVFSDIYSKNDANAHGSLKTKFHAVFPDYFNAHINDSIAPYYFTWDDMIDMSSKLKLGKSYVGLVKAEHVLYGSPKLMIHLQILFNAMLQHSYVPTNMLRGNISPLVKDRDGDLTDSSNYRAITLSSIFIQMYETLEKAKFGYFLPNSDLQFGFKPGISTSHALFSLKKTVSYFTKNKSRTYLAFLDCSKAFDRISHWGLFLKLIQHNLPLCFILSVMFLYLNMSCTVKWNGHLSHPFDIPTGTKQGGILSPNFFAMYVHDLIVILKKSGFGCHLIKICIACIFFADDIVLLSPSRHGLQEMLNICVSYCKDFCLDFNVKKSKVMVVDKSAVNYDEIVPLRLNNSNLEFTNEYKYLGVIVSSGKGLNFPANQTIRSFHRAANSILHSRVKPDQRVLLRLLYSNCIPIISYACSVKEYSSADMYRCHVAVNNAIRKIFSFAMWQSIRHVRIENGYKSIYELFAAAQQKFLTNAVNSSNVIVASLASNVFD